jgi:hypothetical protein
VAARKFKTGSEFYDWLEKVDGTRLNRQAVFAQGHNWAALYDTLVQAVVGAPPGGDVTLPRWAVEAVISECRHTLGQKSTGVGKGHRRWRDRYHQDLIDWVRFQQVWFRKFGDNPDSPPSSMADARRRRKALQKRLATDPSVIDADTRAAARRPARADVGPYPWGTNHDRDDVDVFEAASLRLEGSRFQGSPAAIKKSWDTVNRALRRGEVWRYYPSRWVRLFGGLILAGTDDAR